MDLNKVQIIGRITQDIELRQTPTDKVLQLFLLQQTVTGQMDKG